MRRVLRPVLLHFLRRDPSEIKRRARDFRIRTEEGWRFVERLGSAFIGGFNAMLQTETLEQVAAEGLRVDPHFRPFFFEGAAMGYLPRGYLRAGCTAREAERALLRMHPGFRYLYYVGIGFWFGMRHPGRPSSVEALAAHIDPIYFPLCYDGFGFKIGFYDYPGRKAMRRLAGDCPPEHAPFIHQGFGRALFFVFMDDEEGFERVRETVSPERRGDVEFGRSLAVAFTGVDRPAEIVKYIEAAAGEEDRAARLGGVTWGLAAREMNDPDYFNRCIGAAPAGAADLLRRLPEACRAALEASSSYLDWQRRTRDEVVRLYASFRSS